MPRTPIRRILPLGLLAACLQPVFAQAPGNAPSPPAITIEQPDAQRTRQELASLLERYPPNLRGVFALDPTLLNDRAYLAAYPALVSFLNAHPEVARNPSFYVGESSGFHRREDESPRVQIWRQMLEGLSVFGGFAMAIGLIIWLIRTTLDYRRWNRLAKVQTDVHTRLLDRFTENDDLLAYIQSPAGSRFLQSAPITLDAGPRSMGAPLGRILWSVQAGLVLAAAGIGLQMVGGRVADDAAQPLHALGVLGIALGVGFVISAIISFVIAHRLGLIESPAPRTESRAPQG